jgi:hypothetical protein
VPLLQPFPLYVLLSHIHVLADAHEGAPTAGLILDSSTGRLHSPMTMNTLLAGSRMSLSHKHREPFSRPLCLYTESWQMEWQLSMVMVLLLRSIAAKVRSTAE